MQNLVQLVQEGTQSFVEIVNYNVTCRQYVCAGHVSVSSIAIFFSSPCATTHKVPQIKALSILTSVSNDLASLPAPQSLDHAQLNGIIASHTRRASPITSSKQLTNGTATIPLRGIDIPFHSRLLHIHIDDYRRYLEKRIKVEDVRPEQLVGKWVPNVTGKPFALERAYVEEVQKVVGGRRLVELLRGCA